MSVGRRVVGRTAPPLVWSRGEGARAARGARGEAPLASSDENAKPSAAAGHRANAREVEVAKVVLETADAVTLVLRDGRGEKLAFRAGQFFTVLADVDGETVPRNYSASNAPGDGELHLTIKEKPGGRVSGLLCRTKPGDRLRVLGPFGAFVVEERAEHRRLVLIAGGAGITPLASIARTVLASEPDAEIAIVYANRRAKDVIFASELERLACQYGSRLTVVHVLESRESPESSSSITLSVSAQLGRLERTNAARALDLVTFAAHPEARFYVCGPDGMRDEVLAALAARGVPESSIRIERFVIGPRPHAATSSAAVAPGARPIAIRVKDRTHRTVALPGATVLEAGLAAGAPMPFSCAVGGCGACKVQLVEGEVELEEPNCLTEKERAAGYVLACVGRPCGPCVVEVPADPQGGA